MMVVWLLSIDGKAAVAPLVVFSPLVLSLIFWPCGPRGILLLFILGFIFAMPPLPIIRWIEQHLPALGKKQRLRKLLRSIELS